jgi:hypothetical protein
MAWYTKQLKALEKSKEDKKKKTGKESSAQSRKTKTFFQPERIKSTKHSFPSPVFARNRNRSKTDLP